jgi:uncharacterized protein
VKSVDGPHGPALLDAAIGEHQPHTDVHALMGRVPFRDDRVAGLDWQATAPAASGAGDRILGCPDTGMRWLARRRLRGRGAGAVRDPGSPQQVEIGPWGHGGGTFAAHELAYAFHDGVPFSSRGRG